MIDLPPTDSVPVLRLDTSNDALWSQLRAELLAPDYSGSEYEPALEFIDRPDLSGMDAAELDDQIPRHYPSSYEHPFLVIVDAMTMNSPEHPVLIVDLSEDDTSPSFRALPREVAAIEANLSIANMDFFDFGDNVGDDGVFRGFE